MKYLHLFLTSVALVLSIGIGIAFAKEPVPETKVLYRGDETIIGQTFVYPEGNPKVTGAIVTLQPGAETGPHQHNVPLFAYVLEGQIEVDYGPNGTRVYGPGDALIEAYQSRHSGRNRWDVPVRILVVAIGAEGIETTTRLGE